jgi:hypothetical protein
MYCTEHSTVHVVFLLLELSFISSSLEAPNLFRVMIDIMVVRHCILWNIKVYKTRKNPSCIELFSHFQLSSLYFLRSLSRWNFIK